MATLLIHGPDTGRPLTSLRTLAARAYANADRPAGLMVLCAAALLLAIAFPSDLASHRQAPPAPDLLVTNTEDHLRFVNTAAQVFLPVLLGDRIGVMQSVYVAVSTTVATHGLKYVLNGQAFSGVRLGERPGDPLSRYNTPSGHSSMASSAAWFVARRYGWRHLLYLLPITLLTMYARVELDAHTISAVVVGALIGVLAAMIFTGERARTQLLRG